MNNATRAPKYPIVETDIYPARYAALENPGCWVVFKPDPVTNTYRPCTAEANPAPIEQLGCTRHLQGELAVLHASPGYGYCTLWGTSKGVQYIEAAHPFLWGTAGGGHPEGRSLEECMVLVEDLLEKADAIEASVNEYDWYLVFWTDKPGTPHERRLDRWELGHHLRDRWPTEGFTLGDSLWRIERRPPAPSAPSAPSTQETPK